MPPCNLPSPPPWVPLNGAPPDSWHARLVRYYSFFGFEPVCTVGGNGLSDLPHLLVWGGEGTRMDADVATMLRRWGPAIRRQLRNSGRKGSGSEGGGGGGESVDGGDVTGGA